VDFETLLYSVDKAVATITLHRPERLNTIVPPMPEEFEAAVRRATVDEAVKVIVVRGAGRSFCAGYDFGHGFHHWDDIITTDGRWDPGARTSSSPPPRCSPPPSSSWPCGAPPSRSSPRSTAGVSAAGAMALCADIVIASDDARIGTPRPPSWRP